MINHDTSSASRAASITPSNTVNLTESTRAIYVGVGGDISCEMAGGGTQVFKNLAAGIAHPLQVSRVNSTGTTASELVALF